jgi:uncharacterized protein
MARPANRKRGSLLKGLRLFVLAAILFAVFFGYQTVKLYTDWLWFKELQQAQVFSTAFSARIQLFIGFGAIFFLVVFLNIWLAHRLSADRPQTRRLVVPEEREQMAQFARQAAYWALMAAAVIGGLAVGANASTHWSDYLLYTHAGSFGQSDPVFQKDIGYYVFRLPFLSFLQGWALFTIIAAIAASVAAHAANRALDFVAGAIPAIEPVVRRHLLALAGVGAIVIAWGVYLSRYGLLTRDNGSFFGAGYTDLHARLPAINLLTLLMVVVAGFCFYNIRFGAPFRLPLIGAIAWAVIYFVGMGVWPGFVQKFTVVPNEFGKQKEYIAHDIRLTQKAYGLDKVKEQAFPGTDMVTSADLKEGEDTINNIRLWDWPQLGAVYTNNQAIRPYYRFNIPGSAVSSAGEYNIDVDRYNFGTDYRQVMLGARELYSEALPREAQTWQNQRLQYTHGYGAVMSPVNRVDPQGLPEYFMSQIPLVTTRPELAVTRPQIYYGELTDNYVFVNTQQDEFDFPSGDGNKTTRYGGGGGIALGGMLSRTAWSIRLGDTNMLLSGDLNAESRILFRRGIRERVSTLAPFLRLDNDPYMVVDDGKLVWMLDGYTISDQYPYSKPTFTGAGLGDSPEGFNYVRNSVKAVVDAYDGSVRLFMSDAADPIIQTWGRIFPGLMKPMDQMPAGLLKHVRYPEDLFRIQRDIYTVYHISDPRVYYGKEDAWEVPLDPTPPTDAQGDSLSISPDSKMMPYYVMMRLPDEKSEEFLLMTPFTPLKKQNMAGWMAAKCDPDDYGQLLVYRFPKGSNVNGPQQVIGLIKQQPDVAQAQTLLGQRGSKMIFGNLLVIPVKSSLLYAVPVYVQAADANATANPEIKRVIVASGNTVVMRDTLSEAIASLAPGSGGPVIADGSGESSGQATPSGGSRPAGASGTAARPATGPQAVLQRATTAYQRARARQKEYEQSLDELGKALSELQKSMGGQQ